MLFSCQGYHGDTSKTFLCGNVDDEAKKLVEVCLMTSKSIHMCSNKETSQVCLISGLLKGSLIVICVSCAGVTF